MHLADTFYTLRRSSSKGLAVLIDPDSLSDEAAMQMARQAEVLKVDFFFVGGSLMVRNRTEQVIAVLKAHAAIPTILFPGSLQQIAPNADGILFLSLISGRNPELLIGTHVLAAPLLRQTKLEIIATGYMLVESGRTTTAHYISNTQPLPHDKPDIAACTAMAGEMLGLKLMYLDGGSGATYTVSPEMVAAVATHTQTPLIVGGGIRSVEEARRIWQAGAEVIVIGNALEKDPDSPLLADLIALRDTLNVASI
jgi:phosphoglycerol geranylgeranyltransferase